MAGPLLRLQLVLARIGFISLSIGGDPAVHRAIGVGHGLERLEMLRYGIDDIRKIDGARVA